MNKIKFQKQLYVFEEASNTRQMLDNILLSEVYSGVWFIVICASFYMHSLNESIQKLTLKKIFVSWFSMARFWIYANKRTVYHSFACVV